MWRLYSFAQLPQASTSAGMIRVGDAFVQCAALA